MADSFAGGLYEGLTGGIKLEQQQQQLNTQAGQLERQVSEDADQRATAVLTVLGNLPEQLGKMTDAQARRVFMTGIEANLKTLKAKVPTGFIDALAAQPELAGLGVTLLDNGIDSEGGKAAYSRLLSLNPKLAKDYLDTSVQVREMGARRETAGMDPTAARKRLLERGVAPTVGGLGNVPEPIAARPFGDVYNETMEREAAELDMALTDPEKRARINKARQELTQMNASELKLGLAEELARRQRGNVGPKTALTDKLTGLPSAMLAMMTNADDPALQLGLMMQLMRGGGLKPGAPPILREGPPIAPTGAGTGGGALPGRTPATGAPTGLPDPSKLSGKTVRDTQTNKRYRSDGKSWTEVR